MTAGSSDELAFPQRLTLTALTRRARTGGAAEIDLLLQHAYPFIYTHVRRSMLHPDHHEDCVQDVVGKLLVHLRKDHKPEAIVTWLATTTRRQIIDTYREHNNDRRRQSPIDEVHSDSMWLEDRERLIDDTDVQIDIERSYAFLPAHVREIMLLHNVYGLEIKEIASVIGSTDGAVRKHIARAYITLNKLFGSQFRADGDTPPLAPNDR